jgi:hypothetical protein
MQSKISIKTLPLIITMLKKQSMAKAIKDRQWPKSTLDSPDIK